MSESRQVMYRGGPARTGSYPVPREAGASPAWKYRAGGQITSAPVLAGDTVYVTNGVQTPDSKNAATGSWARAMAHAVDALTGKVRWSVRIEGGSESSPAVAAGTGGEDRGRVYFGSRYGLVYALDAHTGEQIWASRAYIRDNESAVSRGFPAGLGVNIVSSPAVDHGTVYIGGGDCGVYALDAARGTVRWTYQANQELLPGRAGTRPLRPGMIVAPQVRSSPAVVDGVVFICGPDLHLYALDAATGQPRWSSRVRSHASPAVSDGMVYVGGFGEVQALDAGTGTPRWQHQAADLTFGGHQPPAVADGVVYLAAATGRRGGAVVALDAATGERRWLHRCRGPVSTAPAVADGLVQVGTGNHLVALSATTGARRWRRRPGWFAGLVASPSVAGTMLFAGTAEGWLYAMNAPATQLADR